MNLDELIARGEELKEKDYQSPIVDMWENDVKAAVAPYGKATSEVLQHLMFFGQVIMSQQHGQQMHRTRIDRINELLRELQNRNPVATQAQSDIINQKKVEARESLRAKFGNATFHGNVTFGDNSPVNSVSVNELMLGIIRQVEDKLPEGTEKNKILSELKSIVANPTFAGAVAGATLPEIIKRLFGN